MNKSFISLCASASIICLLSFALAQSVSAEALYDVWKKHSQRQPYNGYSNNSAPIDPALSSPTKQSQSRKKQSESTSKAEVKTEATTNPITKPVSTDAEKSTTPSTEATLPPIPTVAPVPSLSTPDPTPPTTPSETVETIVTPEEVITVEEATQDSENALPDILNPFPPQASDDDSEFYSDEIQILRTPENTPEALQELLEEERRLREMDSLNDAVITPDYEEILSQ